MTPIATTVEKLTAENAQLRQRLEAAEAELAMRHADMAKAATLEPKDFIHSVVATEKSAALFSSFMASAPLGIVVFDTSLRYLHLNEQLAEMNGLSVQAHLGKTYQEIVPSLHEQTVVILKRVLREGVVVSDCVVEGETPKSPGVKRVWLVCWFPVRGPDDQVFAVGAIVQEITEQRRVEEQLRKAHEKEQQAQQQVVDLMESLTEGLCVFDERFRFVYVNTAAERINRMPREELLGRTQWEVFPASAGTALEENLRRAMAERAIVEFENYYAPWDTWYAIKAYPESNGRLCVLYRDITQIKREAHARSMADERLRRVFDTQTVGMIEWDAQRGLITAANNYFLNMVGYSAADVAAGRLDFRAMTPPEWIRINDEQLALILHDGRAPAYEKEYLRQDGTRVPIMIAGVRYENSASAGMSVVVDLTSVKRAEADLRVSEGRFRAAIGAVSSCVWTNNAEGMMVGLQSGWENFTGQDQRSYQGYGWSDCVHPDDIQPTINAWQQAVRDTTVFEFEHRVRRRDGKWRICSVRAVPVFDSHGKIAEWVGVHTDITRQRQAETKIKASEVRYRRLFESAKDGILILDARTATITDANPFIAEMMGCAHDEFVGKQLWQIGLFKDVKASKSAMRELQHKRYIRYDDLPLLTKTGKRLNVEFVSNVYGEGTDTVIQCNVRDITERKRLEENLLLQTAELVLADSRKDAFLATLAHELRNPLAPIRNGLKILRLAGNDPGATGQCLDMLERQLGQMVHLVDDLLDVSRISRGKLALRKKRIELSAVLDSAIETSRPLIKANGHTLTVSALSQPVTLDADLTRLGQVFSNLLNNAAKYSEPGGSIHLSVELQAGDVVVRVGDTGIGIAPDMLTKIFDMFTQVNRSLEKAQGGLGIGLCLVKQLVELHGGSVQVHSAGLGLGSEFVVRLPVAVPVLAHLADAPVELHAPDEPDAAHAPDAVLAKPWQLLPGTKPSGQQIHPSPNVNDSGEPSTHTPMRILLADDNLDALSSLSLFLTLLGNEVRTAQDGLQAVETAAQFAPDVILLDIGMPKLNGFDACRRIRQQPGGAKAYLIALTGWGQDEDRRRSHAAGFDHHLVKPADPEALEQLLAGLTKRSSQRA